MARSPLMHQLRRILAGPHPPSRRAFLRTAIALPAAAIPALPARTAPRIAVVGGGISGLYCAWLLKNAGVESTIYESSKRTGGRMFTATGAVAPGVTTELGGEFVDTGHANILAIAKRFGLQTLDMAAESEKRLAPEGFLFDGAMRKPEAIVAEFRAIQERVRADVDAAGGRAAKRFDRLSIDEWLHQVGAGGWLKPLLQVAFRTEYGMDTGEQTSMNLLSMLNPELVEGGINFFGESDERYKILGGNDRVPAALAGELRDIVRLEHRLEAISRAAGAYRLTFATPGGPREVDADLVVMTLPFTILRRLDLKVDLPEKKRRAIRDLGYGTNSKLFMGFERRLWRERGSAGALFTGTDAQLVWDSSRRQPVEFGALTMLMGGKAGVAAGEGTPEDQEKRLLPEVERAWPGLTALRTGKPGRFHWPSYPHSLGAYASYKVGQWRDIRGTEFGRAGGIWFCGEHTSLDAQGYMEGGAETGRRVAEAIAKKLGRRVTGA